MIAIQCVRVRWPATERGAPHANLRRGLDDPVLFPAAGPASEVVLHEVTADAATGYRIFDKVRGGGPKRANEVGLWLAAEGPSVVVDSGLSRWAAYPVRPGPARLFTLAPGEVGRYRANFRYTGCDGSWFYQTLTIHVSNGPVEPGRFRDGVPDHDADHRVHLYGGRARSRRRNGPVSPR